MTSEPPRSDLELALAINRLSKRLMDIGWIDRAALSEGKMHFGYTKEGLAKMQTLKSLLIEEVDKALKFPEFVALTVLLLTLDRRLPDDAESAAASA